ncbi:ketopantoate reductase family protein [Reyranella sp.]|uniref:ketopantoate reductase family protein n=1 Tax=Reyranella sp. TaxID=1929291 RepID=UPI003BAC52E1
MTFPSIAVVGAGGIGGVVAWSLARAGLSPTVIARGRSADALRRDGLTIERHGRRETVRVAVASPDDDIGLQDMVLGTMKAHDWPSAMPLLKRLIGPSTTLIPAINGIPWWYFAGQSEPAAPDTLSCLDPAGAMTSGIDPAGLVGCVVYMGATRMGPGCIDWSSGRRLVLGDVIPRRDGRLSRIAELLRQANLDIVETDDIRQEVWTKLLGNGVFNPLSVVASATMDEMIDDPSLRHICVAAMNELIAVAGSVGIALPVDAEQRLAMNGHMRGFRTSTLQDFEAGRPLEIAALVEAPCAIGAANGVDTPVLTVLGRLVTRFAIAQRGAAHA